MSKLDEIKERYRAWFDGNLNRESLFGELHE
jgi:hypothetical protein